MALQTGVKAIDKFTRQADKMYCDPYAKVVFAGKVIPTSSTHLGSLIDLGYFYF